MIVIIMNYFWLSLSADPSLVERGHHISNNKNNKNIIHINGANGYTDDTNADNDKDLSSRRTLGPNTSHLAAVCLGWFVGIHR